MFRFSRRSLVVVPSKVLKYGRAASSSSESRGEGKGSPFLHAFHKAFPMAPPKVHVKGEDGIYVIDEAGNK
jgi:hypothetical protein